MEKSDILTIYFQKVKHQIPIESILYVESDLRRVLVHTPGKVYQCYRKLAEFEDELRNADFVRCHQSYLIALFHVEHYTMTRVYIQNAIIPISKRYQKQMDKLLSNRGIIRSKPFPIPSKQYLKDNNLGSILCIAGTFRGMVLHFKPEQKILIGRNGRTADIIVNLPEVSRLHCSLSYRSETREYEICDQSRNGTFINGKRLLPGEVYVISPGSELCLGTLETIFKLC